MALIDRRTFLTAATAGGGPDCQGRFSAAWTSAGVNGPADQYDVAVADAHTKTALSIIERTSGFTPRRLQVPGLSRRGTLCGPWHQVCRSIRRVRDPHLAGTARSGIPIPDGLNYKGDSVRDCHMRGISIPSIPESTTP